MEYLLGLDAGTENIGFALTNENYDVVKANGKNVMGVLSYETAASAEARRQFRTARRRLMRRKWRITLLQEIFESEIIKQDDNFLRRLNENDLKTEDRKIGGKYSLFNDANYSDKKYYCRYPTIYHLRKELMQNEPSDIRLLYLAVHHIVKYRGHFLNEGTVNDCKDLLPIMQHLNSLLEERNAQVSQEEIETTIAPLNLARFDDFMQLISKPRQGYRRPIKRYKNTAEQQIQKYIYLKKG